jgi:sugar phosphate isomerase/epimerase
MNRRFSLAHLTVLGASPPEAIHIAADTGYNFVGLRIIPLGLEGEPRYRLDQDAALRRETRQALAQTGLSLLDIEVARIAPGRGVEDYRPALETAAELGGRHVLAAVFEPDRGRAIDAFARLCALAEGFGQTVDLEFMPFSNLVDLKDAASMVAACGAANAGILIDTLHFGRTASTLGEIEAIASSRFHYAQLCDAAAITNPTNEDLIRTARGERLYLGEGVIPVAAIVARLPPVPLSLEIAHLQRQRELGYKAFARACLETARAYFDRQAREN